MSSTIKHPTEGGGRGVETGGKRNSVNGEGHQSVTSPTPLTLAERHPVVRRIDGRTIPVVATATQFQNGTKEVASTEPADQPARALLKSMVASAREPANHALQTDIGEAFAETSDGLDALLATGLHNRLMNHLDRLKKESTSYDLSLEMYHEIFKEIGHGIALTYLNNDDVLLTSEHVARLDEAAEKEEAMTSPDGFIVDKDGKIVLVYATVLVPYSSIVNDTIAGMREFIKRFDYLCGGEDNAPQLLLISPKPKRDFDLDPDVTHKQVAISLNEIVDYARDNIFYEVSPAGRKSRV